MRLVPHNGGDNSSGASGLVCKENRSVQCRITQSKAATLARGMYPGSKNLTSVKSDLMNSYAWDTAIVFIQSFSGDADYATQKRLQNSQTLTGKSTNGSSKDVRCNIYDMAGNYYEWTTESYTSGGGAMVARGTMNNSTCNNCTQDRHYWGDTMATTTTFFTFRPILYL